MRSTRAAEATTVLGSVRARHNDIQAIEKTLEELAGLFAEMGEQVERQEVVREMERRAEDVAEETKAANVQLEKSVESARKARRWKWCCCGLCLVILIALVVVLVVYFLVIKKQNGQKQNAQPSAITATTTIAATSAPTTTGGA